MIQEQPFILSITNIRAADLPLVGGKGANLGELTHAGFNVPTGFCVTTRAFELFMADVKQDLFTKLDDISVQDLEQLRHAGTTVRDTLEDMPLPDAVEKAVVETWLEYGNEYAYAVRSSATAEDLPYASFAGQQDTYLNIRGQEALLASVKSCFVSLFTDRAILYRMQNGFDHRQVALAVVIQRMVQSEVAGILFTADPMTGNRHISSIDASFGLGEALVSGVVSADLYQVDDRVQQIVKRQIASKQVAIRSLAGGGTEQIELAEQEREKAALTDTRVIELAQIGKQIEAHFGNPQDIEWVLEDGRFHIIQSRPITSLFPLPEPKPLDNDLHIYVSLSHFQVMTDAMPPLALSILRTILPVGRESGQLESKYILSAGGRAYADLSPLLRHRLGRRIVLRALNFGDQLAASALVNLVNRPRFLSHGKQLNPVRLIPSFAPYAIRVIRTLFWRKTEGAPSDVLAFMDSYISDVTTKLDDCLTVESKLEFIMPEMRDLFKPILTWAHSMAAGMIALGLLNVLMRNTAAANDLAAIDRGLTGNVATNMNMAVGDLADVARTSEALMAHLKETDMDASERLAHAADKQGGETFLQAWNAFIDRYGARGPSEIDLSRPRWSEDPASLLQMVVNAMEHSEPGTHRAHYQKLIQENEIAANNLIATAFKGWLGWIRGPLVRRFVRVCRNLVPLREHHKFFAMRLLALAKSVLIAAGQQLNRESRLESASDIWFLTLPEVLEAVAKPEEDLKVLVSQRRNSFAHFKNLKPPHVITSEGEIPIARLEAAEAPEGALIGSPVSAGIVEGLARVVLDPGTDKLKPDEILVAPFTDPGWTPLFVNAAGLVTEVGGMMTHGSLVAREYGIPAVVGVLDATSQIKTGQRIRVHGDAGYIEILENGDS